MPKKDVLSDVVFTDLTMPVVYADARLSKGSLFLFDPAHSLGGFAGIPGQAAKVPNVAHEVAKTVVGSGSSVTLAGIATQALGAANAFALERSAKGGVHGMCSQVNQTVTGLHWMLSLPALLNNFISDNLLVSGGHTFYVSHWNRVTRAALASGAPQSLFHMAGNTSDYAWTSGNGSPSGSAGTGRRVTPATADTSMAAGTLRSTSIAIPGYTGTKPALLDALSLGAGVGMSNRGVHLGVGAFDSWTSFNLNKNVSAILYQMYIEDLTVSGRTFAEVDALDFAAYTAAFAVGGRFHGDTWSDPAVVLP